MKKYHLYLDETFEENFQVISIFCHEKDYRLAFLLNKHLEIQLKKATSIVDNKIKTEFPVFEFQDKTFYRNWYLLNNHGTCDKEVPSQQDLFSQHATVFQQKVFYINELKKVPFLLKIESGESLGYYNDLVKKIEDIPQIYAAEILHLTHLKNKNLLIF